MEDIVKLDYGAEEELFHMNHTQRFKPFERGNHVHGTYEVYYLLAGERVYFIKDRSFLTRAGDLVFIPKSEVHKSSGYAAPVHERIVINFSERFLEPYAACGDVDLMAAFKQPSRVVRPKLADRLTVEGIFDKMARELQGGKPGFESYVRLLLAELLLLSARLTAANDAPSREHTDPRHRKISEIVRHINRHYAELITLDALSRRFYISPFYLSRSFKQVTGFSFVEYVTLTRIREARRLLAETDMKVIEVGQAVGFDNMAHFGRTFRKTVGTTPLKYRKGGMA